MEKKVLETDFKQVLFTDEARVTLDGLDGWAKVWSPTRAAISQHVRRQQCV